MDTTTCDYNATANMNNAISNMNNANANNWGIYYKWTDTGVVTHTPHSFGKKEAMEYLRRYVGFNEVDYKWIQQENGFEKIFA